MSKRKHDTKIWNEDWFSDLDKEYKLAFLLIKDLCDYAGTYRPNMNDFKKHIGVGIRFSKFLDVINKDKVRIVVMSNGRWVLSDFIEFQYGNKPNEKLNVHVNVAAFVNKGPFPINVLCESWLSFVELVGKQNGYPPLSTRLKTPLTHGYYSKLSTEDTKEIVRADIKSKYDNISIEVDEEKTNTLVQSGRLRIEDSEALADPPPEPKIIDPPIAPEPEQPEKPEKPKRQPHPKLFADELLLPWQTEPFREAWDFWKEYKHREHKFQYRSVKSEQQSLSLLEELALGDEEYAIAILRYTGGQGYEGFQRPKHIPLPKPKGRFAANAPPSAESVLFKDSPISDIAAFEKAFAGTEYEQFNLGYYRGCLDNWSNRKGIMDSDWKTQAINFMLRDVQQQKAVPKDQIINKNASNNQHSANGNGSGSGRGPRPGTPEAIAESIALIRKQFGGK